MRGLVPRIHVLLSSQETKTWMAGSSPAKTVHMSQVTLAALICPSCPAEQEKIFCFFVW
jgi:hypothetical protein